ncbi:MAG: hypothetical protein ISR65_16490 [Bacteriovoracaceae bacterium]|nr:hypothetical protein [Bacteriovoracaceae bacterium]
MLFYKNFITLSIIILFTTTCTTFDSKISKNLQKGSLLSDFKVEKLYLHDDGKVDAIKLLHKDLHFKTYVVFNPTIYQAAIWFKTPTKTNKSEPHTLEHLILGKGKKGKYRALLEGMELSDSTALTYNELTWYNFNTNAGFDSFMKIMYANLDALLMPDFSDEEVRRELFHYGVEEESSNSLNLKLIEKGTVYTEMVKSQHYYDFYRSLKTKIFGVKHHSSMASGGTPQGIRSSTVDDISEFHFNNYRLNDNLGIIAVIPTQQMMASFLDKFSKDIRSLSVKLDKKQKETYVRQKENIVVSAYKEPIIRPFPSKNPHELISVSVAWPTVANLSQNDELLLALFIDAFGNGISSLLYPDLIDTKSKKIAVNASSIWAGINDDNEKHQFPEIYISGAQKPKVIQDLLTKIQGIVASRIDDVFSWKAGSKKLKLFNQRVRSLISSWIKKEKEFISNPPLFGKRRTPTTWVRHFNFLDKNPNFKMSISTISMLKKILSQINDFKNIWPSIIKKAKLKGEVPYIAANYPSEKLYKQLEKQKAQRISLKLSALKSKYQVSSTQEALSRFKVEYDNNTDILDTRDKQIARPPFTPNPPLTRDDFIQYELKKVNGSIPMTVSYFTMPTVEMGLAFDLKKLPSEYFIYLPILPKLFTQLGLIEGSKVTHYSTFNNLLSLDLGGGLKFYYDKNYHSNRYELVAALTLSEPEDLKKGLSYLYKAIHHNFLHIDNVSRLKDLTEQSISNLSNVLRTAEEYWFTTMAKNFIQQDNKLNLYLGSIFTQLHTAYRLKWQLEIPATSLELDNVNKCLQKITDQAGSNSHKSFQKFLKTNAWQGRCQKVADYFSIRVKELPPEIETGIKYLAKTLLSDLQVLPESVISRMRKMINIIFSKEGTTGYLVANKFDASDVLNNSDQFKSLFTKSSKLKVDNKTTQRWPILNKVIHRNTAHTIKYPIYVGLENNSSTTGNIFISANAADLNTSDKKKLVSFLASKLYTWTGPHGAYMQTWSAGLAYGNGLSTSYQNGKQMYYATRSPSLLATTKFVANLTKKYKKLDNPYYLDYIYSTLFTDIRVSETPKTRGVGIYRDIKDGITPQKVKKFKLRLLKLRQVEGDSLYHKVLNQFPQTNARVTLLPQNILMQKQSESVVFMVAPIQQLDDIDKYIKQRELFRIYPSDFWID